MKKHDLRFWLQAIAICAAVSLVICLCLLGLLRLTLRDSNALLQRNVFLPSARVIESAPYEVSVPLFDRIMNIGTERTIHLWVIDENNAILAHNNNLSLPKEWASLDRPAKIHDMTFKISWFSNFPDLLVIRLDKPQPTYLLLQRYGSSPSKTSYQIRILFFFFVSLSSALSGLGLTSLYLRHKSTDAKRILQRIKAGDLKARFEPRRFDYIGKLMLDFNSMADEIEQLVHRLRTLENTRRDMLEELSHDLRTPLTSLSNAVEILTDHGDALPMSQRDELLKMVHSELDYFKKLIEDLFFIVNLETAQDIDLQQQIKIDVLVDHELNAFPLDNRLAGAKRLERKFLRQPENAQFTMTGNVLLIRRLIRNGLQNACRHARSQIILTLQAHSHGITLTMDDDGPGISQKDIETFGQRKLGRVQMLDASHAHSSLGLGSVIMKTIIELHGGKCRIENLHDLAPTQTGTRLSFEFSLS